MTKKQTHLFCSPSEGLTGTVEPVNRGRCGNHVDTSATWPRRVRIVSDRKIHDLICRDWADLLDLAHMSHAAIFRDNAGNLILAEMDWEAQFWGHA